MTITELRQRLRTLGALPKHEARVLRDWVQARPHDSGRRRPENFLPLAVREALPALDAELHSLTRLISEHPGEDGSARLLVGLRDGQTVESVLLPRGGLCVSSQVGCAVGCQFCMTGRDGLIRQVTSAEIVAQVVLARHQRAQEGAGPLPSLLDPLGGPGATRRDRGQTINKVVFMGMGEPAHNLENVMEAIELLGTEGNIGHKNLVFSTVGDPRVFERLPLGAVKPALALSLHTSKPDLRAELLPRAPRLTPQELVDAGEHYAQLTGYPIQYQWTLIEGVNDGEDEMDGIVALLKGKYGVLNMIPYNTIPDLAFKRPSWERASAIAQRLHQRGVLTKLRDSAGQDVEGGCGQLRARDAVGRKQRVVPINAA